MPSEIKLATTDVLTTPNQRFVIRQERDAVVLEGELLNIDYTSPVEIEWRETGGRHDFSWRSLDAEDIGEWLAMRRRLQVRTRVPTLVEVRNPVWPHVRLTIELEQDFSATVVTGAIQGVVESWEPERGAIHKAGALEPVGARMFSVLIDFGSADVDALNRVLDAIANIAKTRRVIVDS